VWLAIGALAGFVVAVMRDLSRNTIVSLSNLGKHRGYSILGAAPDLTAQSLRELAPDKRTPVGCLAFQPASAFATAFRDLQGALEHERMVAFIGASRGLHPDFGGDASTTGPDIYGMPYAVVGATQPKKAVHFVYASESDGVDHATNQSFPSIRFPTRRSHSRSGSRTAIPETSTGAPRATGTC
jgi:hypothetical protein